MSDLLTIDGAHGEGGGQILRTALSLSLITARPVRIANIRSGRPKSGLRPQHLSAVRAAAVVAGAMVTGDYLGSGEITSSPAHAAQSGEYTLDVATAARQGSAGAVTLMLQTLLVPLALARGASSVVLLGGTHVPWSPPFDSILNAYLPLLRAMGLRVDATLIRWGWYPVGQGRIVCSIGGRAGSDPIADGRPQAVSVELRGALKRIDGRAVVANLPEHIAQRMADEASRGLSELNVPVDLSQERVEAACAGAGLFLNAHYERATASFSALGRRGKPAEAVAAEAMRELKEHHASRAAVDLHLADQLLLPLAVASGPSTFTAARTTRHLITNAWTIEQFGAAKISIEASTPIRVRVHPRNPASAY